MKIRFGYDMISYSQAPTPMIVMLKSLPHATQRLLICDQLKIEPAVPLKLYGDPYGNRCVRLVAPAGSLRMSTDALLEDSGRPEPAFLEAPECSISDLPKSAMMYLLPSRYCESDVLSQEAQRLFGHLAPGWSRVQAVCDFVNRHVTFGYQYARSTKTALDTYRERQGVCRDFAHLAITLCRGLNIPARYTTSYLGDIGVPAVDAPMDFAGAMEVYLGGGWHCFDPRNNARRIGRLIIARGRDAADVAISTAFGAASLQLFRVWTDEINEERARQMMAQRSAKAKSAAAVAA